MTKLNLISPITSLFLFFLTTMNHQFSYARTLTNSNPTPTPIYHHNHHHQKNPNFKFIMQNVLNVTQNTKPKPRSNTQTQIPFPKPIGYFPPKNGIPLPPSFDFSSNYNYNNNLMSFLPKAAPQELEIGSVTEIDEHLFEELGTTTTSSPSSYGSLILGKAQGMFVGSSENINSHNMVAFTVSFFGMNNINNNIKDGLRLFGVYKRGISEEFHIAVIGGIGKYEGANGYAVLKPIDHFDEDETKKLLLFNVYLS